MLALLSGIGAGVAGFVAGAALIAVRLRARYDDILHKELTRSFRTSSGDQNSILSWAQRYYGQIVFLYDENRFKTLYRKTLDKIESFKNADDERIQSAFDEITNRIKHYGQFEDFKLKDFVVYDYSDDLHDIEDIYRDALLLSILKRGIGDTGFGFEAERVRKAAQAVSEARKDERGGLDDSFMDEYIQRYKDTILMSRVVRAVNEFEAFCSEAWGITNDLSSIGKNSEKAIEIVDERTRLYKGSFFSITRLSHFAEERYGLHFEDNNEYAIYGVFTDDKRYVSVYRSNKDFDQLNSLDCISGMIPTALFDAYRAKRELEGRG